ncbi:MAG: hypothetical protein RMJ37_04720 [Spirochaetia bacterium]|nr:hypothetical protein [Spirochaetota bacterium]MCX8097200.1 hypothetical protein [Spirochaetota bacterium]MDW8112627.1 hypothetical protein [Spirochaetia bacterium]
MRDCVVITIPPINLANFLSLSEDRSFHEIYVAGRFKVIDWLIGNFERLGIEDFVVITNNPSVKEHIILSWDNIRFVLLIKVEDYFKFDYANFGVGQYIRQFSNSDRNYFDLENFLYQNYKKVFWAIGYPIWFPLDDYYHDIRNLSVGLMYSRIGNIQYYHTGVFSQRYFSELFEAIKNETFNTFIQLYKEHNSYEVKYFIFYPFSNLKEYFKMNLSILDIKIINEFEVIFGKYPIRSKSRYLNPAVIGRHGKFINSLIGDESFVDGVVENSIVCPNVRIEKDTKVRNAIIYPGNWIGKGVEMNNVVIDETTISLKFANISDECVLGGKGLGAPNTRYPSIMNFDATLIGKNVILPRKTQVSLNAYIPSNIDVSKLKLGKHIKSSTVF